MAQIDGADGKDVVHDPLIEDQLDSFEFIDINEKDMNSVMQENAYLRELHVASGLKILQQSKVLKACQDNGKMGLFRSFII